MELFRRDVPSQFKTHVAKAALISELQAPIVSSLAMVARGKSNCNGRRIGELSTAVVCKLGRWSDS